jgi:transposase-like protein
MAAPKRNYSKVARRRRQNSMKSPAARFADVAFKELSKMSRKCGTCQHVKRAEVDRRLAAGEPSSEIAKDYGINPSSLHRHRANCLKLASSSAIMKEASRGTAAVACLPSKDELSSGYANLLAQIDDIVAQAKAEGSLPIALKGLNSIRQTLDSLSRLAGFDHQGTQVNVAVQTNVNIQLTGLVERIIKHFDHEPELKARIAQALLEVDNERAA